MHSITYIQNGFLTIEQLARATGVSTGRIKQMMGAGCLPGPAYEVLMDCSIRSVFGEHDEHMLLNFPRFNKMKGMGQIITWSVRDESLHCDSIIKLFRTLMSEHPELWDDQMRSELTTACKTIIEHEDAFIDLSFGMGPVEGLEAQDVKDYIRYIGDRRLQQLGLDPEYHIEKNPLPWLDSMLNAVEHTNFFENRATEYSKAATQGNWEEAFN